MIFYFRFRNYIAPALLYSVTLVVCAYFVDYAVFGVRGLQARAAHIQQMTQLTAQLTDLQQDEARWRHRIQLIRGGVIDEDLLDEQARTELGDVGKDDVVVMLPKGTDD